MSLKKEIFAGEEVTLHDTLVVEGRRWDIGTACMDPGWGKGEKFHYTLALPEDRAFGIMMQVESIDKDGKIEDYILRRQTRDDWNGEQDIPRGQVPAPVLERLESLANEKLCFFNADYRLFSAEAAVNTSFTTVAEGKRWGLSVEQVGEQGRPVPIITEMEQDAEGRRRQVGLYPTQLHPDGSIAKYMLFTSTFSDAGNLVEILNDEGVKERRWYPTEEERKWREVTEKDNIPQKLVEDMLRFGNHFKLLGDCAPDFQEAVDAQVELAMGAIDAKHAGLMHRHYQDALKEAHEKGEDTAFLEREAALHAQSVKALWQPKGFADRVEEERRQAEAIEKNGDSQRFRM